MSAASRACAQSRRRVRLTDESDWEISVILGVSEATARRPVDNPRRKLGAVNRAQAEARMAAAGLL
jgi:LuxR family quorum sensing-dependent transcriptional regulator